ncbi:TauD/TfdA family dioxygenase [Halomonas sp. M4R1S46]|uniref:2-trimethylaminoethylphosphonate dioxygenase n=1 Tax=Halomonas sp. M4R1S46 TaxID=2982692 RepID=UPI0021E3F9D7|nr:TauD/TfdA family dioxygenase [Halomonas sp. M4R1S46]UYG09264.1 TauD/TfdA family dioxygenase [Halomonas sp. M4R1S46]
MTASGKPRLSPDGQRLTLDLDDQTREFAALWLRERTPDTETLDPRTGQRLIEAADLPLDLALEHVELAGDALALRFSDGHATHFPLTELRADTDARDTIVPGRTLWDARLAEPPRTDFVAALDDDTALLEMLEGLHRYGFVLVSGVPTDEDGMQALIDRIGPLRRTNWGGIADVKSVADAYDLTMTQRGLEPHTDNPYRDPIPGYIWLHCLTNAAAGGDNTLVDGYRAAQLLRERDPAAFDCLTRVSPGFRYSDDTTWLESEGPLIELDGRGQVMRVRYSNRTERVEALPAEELARYYAARRAFFELITSEELTVHLKLDPGQMLIMDNYRLLHGRRAYELAGGVRHLRQGYVDRDSTASRRLVLRRQLAETGEVA